MTLHISPQLDLPLDAVTEVQVAWAAGIFEGDGTVTIARRALDDTFRLQVQVSSTDEEIIRFFHRHWRGWVTPAYGLRPRRQPAWQWIAAGPTAERFLRAIAEQIRTARVMRKIDVALSFRERQTRPGVGRWLPDYKPAQREFFVEMRGLNARGQAALDLAGGAR